MRFVKVKFVVLGLAVVLLLVGASFVLFYSPRYKIGLDLLEKIITSRVDYPNDSYAIKKCPYWDYISVACGVKILGFVEKKDNGFVIKSKEKSLVVSGARKMYQLEKGCTNLEYLCIRPIIDPVTKNTIGIERARLTKVETYPNFEKNTPARVDIGLVSSLFFGNNLIAEEMYAIY